MMIRAYGKPERAPSASSFRARRAATAAVLLAAVVLSASPSPARILIVDPAGRGDALTIGEAMAVATSGDEVIVKPGLYRETVNMKTGVRLRSTEGAEGTLIDGGGAECIACWRCQEGTLIEGFTLTGGGSVYNGALFVGGYSDVEIADCVLRDNDTVKSGTVQVQKYSHALIRDCRFIANRSHWAPGISAVINSRIVVERCYFQDNFGEFRSSAVSLARSSGEIRDCVFIANRSFHDGVVSCSWGSSQVLIVGNTFLGNVCLGDGAAGVYAHDGAVIRAERNVFAFNRGGPAAKLRVGELELHCNLFWENASDAEGIDPPAGRDGNLAADPRLVLALDASTPCAADSPCLGGPCGDLGARPRRLDTGETLTAFEQIREHLWEPR